MFLAIVIISLLLGLLYTWTLRSIYTDWVEVPVWIIPKAYKPRATVTILVPARNEEDKIHDCVQSLLAQVWPRNSLKIIVLDDHSSDRTAQIINDLLDSRVEVIQMADVDPDYAGPAYKKRAIQYGVSSVSSDFILTTDADCTHHKHWVASMVSLAEHQNKEFVTGPVRLTPVVSQLEKYQALDALGMNAVNASGLHKQTRAVSCGANSLFTPALFKEVNGYDGVDDIATGDDVFLVEKIMNLKPDTIAFNKSREAIVDTHANSSFSQIINQRHRWAVKFKRLNNNSTRKLMMIVGVYYALFWLSVIAAFIVSFQFLFISAILYFFKVRSDFWYLRQLTREFEQGILTGFPVASLLSYIIDPIVVLKALFQPKYTWKGRKVI